MDTNSLLDRAAEAISSAEAFLFTAGAGMGVDSGLPDFRGDQGFWRAYPPYERLGLSFEDMASPRWFRDDPGLAWGFYGHRLELYRQIRPHAGFAILRQWAAAVPRGAQVFTSNVDGQFQRAGFAADRIVERHGAIDTLQCLDRKCGVGLVSAEPFRLSVNAGTGRAADPLPACPACGGLLRPNILMFGDNAWDDTRTCVQQASLERWLAEGRGERVVVVECGAGTAIPTVRHFGEQLATRPEVTLLRINLREPEVAPGLGVGLAMGALDALGAIDARVAHKRSLQHGASGP